MALTTNQGLTIPNGTDNANVPTAFTNYNTNLENRLVQRYMSLADRTARNPLPNDGELSFLADLGIYETFVAGFGWTPLIAEEEYASSNASYFVTSTVFVDTGAVFCGVTTTVPPSGRIRVAWTALLNHSTTSGLTLVAPQVNSGSTIGSGGVLVAATDQFSARASGTVPSTGSSFTYFSGLVAGAVINVFLVHRVTVITGSVTDRGIEVKPA